MRSDVGGRSDVIGRSDRSDSVTSSEGHRVTIFRARLVSDVSWPFMPIHADADADADDATHYGT